MKRKIPIHWALALLAFLSILPTHAATSNPTAPLTRLDPVTQPKFVNRLKIPPVLSASSDCDDDGKLRIRMRQARQDLGLFDPKTGEHLLTTVWGYKGMYPGPTIEARSNETVRVDWINNLPQEHLFPIDHSMHGNMGVPDVRTVVHLHGAVASAASDGYPEDWWTPDPHAPPNGLGGPAGNHLVDTYPNEQEPATLWYHDHALGITSLNVYAGLAGFWLVRDPKIEKRFNLPRGKFEIPLLIQDRDFNSDGSLLYPTDGDSAEHHSSHDQASNHQSSTHEYTGDFNLVNGKAWPFLKVEPRKYRFRILDGANGRAYRLHLSTGQPFIVIGNDRGYLNHPAPTTSLLISNAERYDVVVDFSGIAPGTKITMTNSEPAFAGGPPPNPATVGLVMQFVVGEPGESDDSEVPKTLNDHESESLDHAFVRRVTLNQFLNPFIVFLNNTDWDAPTTELPRLNTTEVWEFINLTEDNHPMHLHLIQFEVLNRQKFDVDGYLAAYNKINAGIPRGKGGTVISPVPFLQDGPVAPDATESGPKDTVIAPPGMVTRIVVKFPDYRSFDPTQGNYVWHCHILEHEDHDMMRPYHLVRPGSGSLVWNH